MTKKQILNITAFKKRDKLRVIKVDTYGNAGTPGTNINLPHNPGNDVTGQRVNFIPFCCTARTSLTGQRFNEADRTAQTIYAKGYSENLRIVTPDSNEWVHRRICFALKGPSLSAIQNPYYFTGNNVYRLAYNNSQDSSPSSTFFQQAVYQKLFMGGYQTDWDDPMIAQIDTRRVDLKYDKTRYIRSGNTQPVERTIKFWHPMNKNITYDDDQTGVTEASAAYSVSDKRGMGDYYIIDLIRCTNPDGADNLFYEPSGTLYWHEK